MYAIRSYYALQEKHETENKLQAQKEEAETIRQQLQEIHLTLSEKQQLKQITEDTFHRITSYNVCYTKLLRVFRK